jgi:glutathione S-transferase
VSRQSRHAPSLAQVHKSFEPLFGGAAGEAREAAVAKLFQKLALLEERVSKQRFLAVPDAATFADYHLLPMLGWLGFINVRRRE